MVPNASWGIDPFQHTVSTYHLVSDPRSIWVAQVLEAIYHTWAQGASRIIAQNLNSGSSVLTSGAAVELQR